MRKAVNENAILPKVILAALLLCIGLVSAACANDEPVESDSDWRQPDPDHTLYLQLPMGMVVIELAPNFAPQNVANILTLVREEYFDGLPIVRSQDNYVVQWADPAEDEADAKPLGSAATGVTAEFQRAKVGTEILTIDSRDAYADIVGFVDGFPVGSDGTNLWLTHCYGMVGVARGNDPNGGNGSSLYVVTGHAPRHLDRNITLVGRVLVGMEYLSTLPRGTGSLGFYETSDEYLPIRSIRTAAEAANPPSVEIMRTETAAFGDYVRSRMHRKEEWFVEPTGKIEICNINPPIRSPR